ncbi:ejaculatory bulb-specific protein 3-like [Athalia rosae]|uniref:ejaculatory bulb-specific protein 3-like n=1 Tax=Athalia rosae TaxID=37344 RepID=UPI002033C993|nr:ejaculatory bulb-specific protein 3-like [Athalia rosae]
MAHLGNVAVVLVLCFGVFASCQQGSIEELLADTPLVRRQIACLLNEGPCDDLGRSAKVSLKEVLINNCARCQPQQRANAAKVVQFVSKNYPKEWARLVKLYGGNARRS